MKAIIYSAVFLGLLAVGVTSLKCYICDSITSTDCGHGTTVGPQHLKECSTGMGQLVPPENLNYTLCRKITTTVDFDVNTNKKGERISRVCGWETSKYDGECYYRGGLGGRTNVCTCTELKNSDGTKKKDGECNGANTFGAAIATITLPAIFLIVNSLRS